MYKYFREGHKWLGIVLGLAILNIAVTGFLLLIKKDHDWIQPPTQMGESGVVESFITNQDLFTIVLAQGHPDFTTIDDVDRIDFRPGMRVFKVRSIHNHSEIQVDAVSGAVLSTAVRNSDLIESLHDGSFFGGWVHEWVMPATSISLVLLLGTGLYLWLQPKYRRIRRRNGLGNGGR